MKMVKFSISILIFYCTVEQCKIIKLNSMSLNDYHYLVFLFVLLIIGLFGLVIKILVISTIRKNFYV